MYIFIYILILIYIYIYIHIYIYVYIYPLLARFRLDLRAASNAARAHFLPRGQGALSAAFAITKSSSLRAWNITFDHRSSPGTRESRE